jgi:ATP-dependent protease ClpP protease subunit
MSQSNSDSVITQTGTSSIKSISVTGTINDDAFKNFLTFHRENIEKGVTEAFIYIDSPGGYVHSYRSIQALITSGEVTYHTVAMGHACSAACLMSAQGTFRWAIPNCEFMFHDVGYGTWGKVDEVEESVNQTHKPLSWWMKKAKETERHDFYFSAEEALEWGVIDFIGVPIVDRQPSFAVELPVSGEELEAMVKARSKKPKDDSKKKPTKKVAKPKKKSAKKKVKRRTP